MAVSQAFQNQEVLAGTCIGNNAVEAVVFCELKAFVESALTPTAVCVFVLVPLLPMVVAQESAQIMDSGHQKITVHHTGKLTTHLQSIVITCVPSGFNISPPNNKSFSILACQVQ